MTTYYMHTREGRPALVQWHSGDAHMPMFGIGRITLGKHTCATLKQLRAQQEEVLLSDPGVKAEDLGYVRLVLP